MPMLNALRAGLLLAALTAISMAVGYVIGGTTGMILALGMATLTNFFGYWSAHKLDSPRGLWG
jgi:heat shock protein HtpX